MTKIDLAQFIQKLQYEFQDKNLLIEALRHSSYVNEQAGAMQDNERFEFLGDAVINLVVGHILMQRHPDLKEGDLSVIRASLVNESRLAAIARTIDLGIYILLGKGESQTNGREKNSILADTFEAVIAAIYLDGGFEVAFKIIDIHFSPLWESVVESTANHHFKSQIQEFVQATSNDVPCYTVINESGPEHEKTFTVRLKIGKTVTQGVGKSKKMAEQDAARIALLIIKNETH